MGGLVLGAHAGTAVQIPRPVDVLILVPHIDGATGRTRTGSVVDRRVCRLETRTVRLG